MNDSQNTINDLKAAVKKFVEDREWQQFHSPKNLSMALAAEAAELMELFLWCDNEQSQVELEKHRQDVEHEIADIALILFNFCLRHSIDLSLALERKIAIQEKKYPIEKARGNWLKYNQFD